MSIATKLRTTGVLTAPLVIALTMAGMSPAAASTAQRPATAGTADSQAGSCADQASTTGSTTGMTQVEGPSASSQTDAIAAAVTSGEVVTQAPQTSISWEDAKVYTIDTDGPTYTSVTVPVEGGYSMVSNLTVILDESGEIVQSGETLISRNDAGNFNISTFADGALVRSDDTDRPFLTDAQLEQDTDAGIADSAKGAGSTAACVATVLGVSGGTAYLIVGACAGACTIPIAGTAICIACIGAYAAVGGASITAVASCF